MKKMALSKSLFIGACLSFILLTGNVLAVNSSRSMTAGEATGKQYFEGSARFENGGPSCVSCHSVNNSQVAKGGLLAKNLTDVYTRLGEGISAWLMAPSFPAMATSYQDNPLTEKERKSLAEFLKYVNEVKAGQNEDLAYDKMLVAGLGGFAGILVLISLIWFKRKRNMVKEDIFRRQSKAWDAKH